VKGLAVRGSGLSAEMPFSPHVEAFVQAAVRLPHERLRRIDRNWSKLAPERRIVSELVQANNEVRVQMDGLREYLAVAARMAGATGEADTGARAMRAEEVAEAIFPAARAVMLREQMEKSPLSERAQAYVALTAPFWDLL
jgi:hypothetical protein